MPVAQRICWNRFLRGEESSIKCCFPARLWSSLGVAGLHPAGGVWGTAGRAPGHQCACGTTSSFLHLPRLACCLARTSWIAPSSRLGAGSRPLGSPSFGLSVPLTIGPPALLASPHPGLPAGVQRGGWAGAPGAGSRARTLRAQPTPDLTWRRFLDPARRALFPLVLSLPTPSCQPWARVSHLPAPPPPFHSPAPSIFCSLVLHPLQDSGMLSLTLTPTRPWS